MKPDVTTETRRLLLLLGAFGRKPLGASPQLEEVALGLQTQRLRQDWNTGRARLNPRLFPYLTHAVESTVLFLY